MADKLTPKQKAFADAYIETGNASEAARRAGYKAETAGEMGSENLKKPHVSAYINERMRPTEQKRIASADEVLLFLSGVMRGEIRDQFGLDASLSDRISAAKELQKRHDAAAKAEVAPVQISVDGALFDNIADMFIPVHRDIAKMKHAEYWFKGGRGSTKSSFISLEIIRGMREDENAHAVVFRRVGNTIKDSVYEQLIWAIDALGVGDEFIVKKSPLEIERKGTGQRILFRGTDDPKKSKSLKLSKGYFKFLWFEELAEFRGMEDVRTIKQSVFRGTDKGITLYSYNPPKSAQNWVNSEALNPRPDRLVHHSTYLGVPAEWLKEAFISEAEIVKQTNERAYANEYLGEVTGSGGNVFENLVLREIPDAEIEGFGYTYAGLDFGWYPDPTHFVRCAYDPARRRLWVYDEYRTVKTPNRELFDHLVKEKKLTPREEVIGDSADQKSIHDLRSFGMDCVAATKGPGSVGASIRWLQSLAEIVVDPVRCPAAAKEFQQYEYEQTRDGEYVAAYPDKNNHAIDAVRYALNRVWLRAGT